MDMSQHAPSSYSRQGSNGGGNHQQQAQQQQAGTGQWDAIIAERQNPYHGNSGNSSYQRSEREGGHNNRNGRDNNGNYGEGQPDDNNYGERYRNPYGLFHLHVGDQSGDGVGADWNKPLPANANLER